MLDCLPIYHWFHCGNPYSGAQGGMRYLVAPAKKADPAGAWGMEQNKFVMNHETICRGRRPRRPGGA